MIVAKSRTFLSNILLSGLLHVHLQLLVIISMGFCLHAFMVTEFNKIVMGWQLCQVVQSKWHSRSLLCLHHQGSDMTWHSAIVVYQSVPGEGLW